tara:strand:+ start:594 stop:1469 length:876 start_codon:yes stop_codon:yes gene_type:complete
MDFETILRILDQIIWTNENRNMRKIRTVHPTGGEPFMWKSNDRRIGDVVRAIQEHGFDSLILTSGTHPKDKGFKRYMEGIESIADVDFFDVYHSLNLYMAGVDIVTRLKHTIPSFDEVLGSERELGFFCVYDRLNIGATVKALETLMADMGYQHLKSRSTRNWREKLRKGKSIELLYTNGRREAYAEFLQIYGAANRARKNCLRPVRVNKKCLLLDNKDPRGKGTQPVIGYMGDVYPCWAGSYPDTKPLGNINNDHLSTILGRERAYIRGLKARLKSYSGRTDVCKFCVDV